ncbi:hypothetical protein ABT299_11595 [Spirillospora sp. NPDC000708]
MLLGLSRLSAGVAMFAVVVSACGAVEGKEDDRAGKDAPDPRTAADGTERLKRALLPMPPAQADDPLRYGPVAGPYSAVVAQLTDGRAWPTDGRCVKLMSVPGRIEELGGEGRLAPAALAMWTDRARGILVQETILRLSGTATRRLVSAEVPGACRSYSYSLEGRRYRRTLKSDLVRQRGDASERIQLIEDQDGKGTTRACTLIHQRGEYALLLSVSQARASFLSTVCLDVIKEAGARAAAALRQ